MCSVMTEAACTCLYMYVDQKNGSGCEKLKFNRLYSDTHTYMYMYMYIIHNTAAG